MIGVGLCLLLDVETLARSSAPSESVDMKGLSSSVTGASLWLWIGVESLTVDGIAVGRGFKKESIDPSFFFFFSLSRFSLAALQVNVPRCRFSKFASPAAPHFTAVPHSGQTTFRFESRINGGVRVGFSI
jgi:hypothetical protein